VQRRLGEYEMRLLQPSSASKIKQTVCSEFELFRSQERRGDATIGESGIFFLCSLAWSLANAFAVYKADF